jgi:hypothetical protein
METLEYVFSTPPANRSVFCLRILGPRTRLIHIFSNQLRRRSRIFLKFLHASVVLCLLYLAIGESPRLVLAQANTQGQSAKTENDDLRLIETVAIDRSEPDAAGCRETATGLQDRWLSIGDIFTEVSNLRPSVLSVFWIFPRDNDHMEIEAPGNVAVDHNQLGILENAIQAIARPTHEITVQGWIDRDGQHHSGHEFWDLMRTDRLEDADLRYARFDHLRFNGHVLTFMDFTGASFKGASLCHLFPLTMGLNFTDADLTGASLANSSFPGTLFINAKFINTDLTGARFDGVDLAGAIFQPSSLPPVDSFAHAKNIQQVSYSDNPQALNTMRRQLEDAGFHDAARKVIFALNETEDAQLRHSCRPPDQHERTLMIFGGSPPRTANRGACLEYYVRKLLFEKTNSYGMQRTKPLLLLVIVWMTGAVLFWICLQRNTKSGLSVRLSRRFADGSVHSRAFDLTNRYWSSPLNERPPHSLLKRVTLAIKDQTRLASAAAFYSLTSVTTLSFRDWDPARWLSLLLDRNYQLEGRGWVKRLAGAQALVSLYLLVLLVLSFFGLPFS